MFRMSKTKTGYSKSVYRGGRRDSGKVEQPGTSTFQQSPRELNITIPVPSPSPNAWTTKHWRQYHQIKESWINRLHYATLEFWGEYKFGPPIEQAFVTIERKGIRLLDNDNLQGGVKPILDALIKLGFLADDKPDVLQRLDVFQNKVKTKRQQLTRITLSDKA